MSNSVLNYTKSSSPCKFISTNLSESTPKESLFKHNDSSVSRPVGPKLVFGILYPRPDMINHKQKKPKTDEIYLKAPKPKVSFTRIASMSGDLESPSPMNKVEFEGLKVTSIGYTLEDNSQKDKRSQGFLSNASIADSGEDMFPYIQRKVHPDDYSDLSV